MVVLPLCLGIVIRRLEIRTGHEDISIIIIYDRGKRAFWCVDPILDVARIFFVDIIQYKIGQWTCEEIDHAKQWDRVLR